MKRKKRKKDQLLRKDETETERPNRVQPHRIIRLDKRQERQKGETKKLWDECKQHWPAGLHRKGTT